MDIQARARKNSKMSERVLVLGVRYPQSGVQEVLQNQQLYLIFSLKSSFCASFLPSNKDSNPHSSIFTYKNHQITAQICNRTICA